MRMLFVNLIILFSFLLPGVQTSLADLSPNTPDESRGLIYLPGSHNDWDLDADNLVPTREFLGGAIAYYGTTITASLDGEFKIVDGDWAHNWGAGYWITDYDIRWTIGWDGTNAAWKGSPGTYLHINIQQPEDYYNSVLPVGILSLSAMPVTVGQVSEVGEPFNDGLIAPGEQLIQCSLSGTPSPEEIIYLRYSTDEWATFHFLQMMGSGSERSATIPDYPIGTAIAYYVMSTTLSFQTGNALDNYPDLMTISYNTNLGNNFNYSVCGDSDGDGLCNDLDPEPDCITNDTDNCGVCGGNNLDVDCLGDCFGNAADDCTGVCDGNATYDDCDICSGGTTGLTPNADMDCTDTCFGSAINDCNGTCNGSAAVDDCGICAGGTTGLIPNANDLGCGCNELAPQPWCSDVDQDGLGDPASQTDYCSGDIPEGWVTDCNDTTPSGSFHLAYGSADISGAPTGSVEIIFNSSFSVSVLLFDMGGLTLTDADLAPEIQNMGIGVSGSTVTIFSPSGTDFLEPGSGTLATIYFEYDYEDGAESCITIQDIFDDFGNTPETTVGDCILLTLPPADCAGVPNGPNLTDDCGDCDDNPVNDNEAQDCTGLCFGTAAIDECGFCSGGTTELIPNADMDCAGECFGDAIEDCAGTCEGPAVTDPNGDCCQPENLDSCGVCDGSNLNMDCNGDCFGSAVIDDCFYCVDGNSGDVFNFMMDDCDVCGGNNEAMDCTNTCFGDAVEDCLGVCEGTAFPDCNDECNGPAQIDDCGACAGGNTELIPNADMDCAGVCFGDAIEDCSGTCNGVFVYDDYEGCCAPDSIDECGQCFGGNQMCSGCMDPEACNYDPDAWVPDISDCEYPPENFDCDGNCLVEIDCLGECGGLAFIDDCGVCFDQCEECDYEPNFDCNGDCIEGTPGWDGGASGTAYIDACGVCSGGTTELIPNADIDCTGTCFGDAELDCAGICNGESMIDDCGDCVLPGFPPENVDCAGVCWGDAIIDDCGVCAGGTTGLEINADMDCSGECFGEALEDCAGACDGIFIPDGFGGCCALHAMDECGVCYGGNELCSGCMDTAACNFDPDALVPDISSCEYPPENFDCNGDCIAELDCNDECGGSAIENECGCVGGSTGLDSDFCYGCTDPEAYNYDEFALLDNGNCHYQEDLYLYFGEVDEQAHTMEVWWNAPSSVAGFQIILDGVTIIDIESFISNYPGWQLAFDSDSGTILGFTFGTSYLPAGEYLVLTVTYSEMLGPEACLFNYLISTPPVEPPYNVITGECHTFLNIEGCTDSDACNYNLDAAIDDGSCEYPAEFFDCEGNCLHDWDSDGICDEQEIEGCMDPEGCNYDPEATDDGDCFYVEEFYDCFGNCLADIDCLGVCGGTAELDWMGDCCDPDGLNECGLCFGEEILDCEGVCYGDALEDDCGVCTGGTTELEFNENMDCNDECYGLAIENECGCVEGSTGLDTDFCYGCTDPEAYNYDETATIDDGSCQYQQDLYLYFGEVDEQAHTMEVWMNAPDEVSGFQFVITGIYLTGVYGGVTDFSPSWPISTSNNGSVIGFVFWNHTLPAGDYLLGIFTYSEILDFESCLTEPVFSAPPGNPPYNVIVDDCYTFLNIEGCTDPDASNYNPDASIDDGSCVYNIPGDITQDGAVDVVDVVFMVNVILQETLLPEAQMIAGDLYQDGVITILDLVWLINIILGNDLALQIPMTATALANSGNEISVDIPDGISAMQIDFEGDFSITQSFLPAGWQFTKNDHRIILFSMDGSPLTQSKLFRYSGDVTIQSALAVDRTLNQRQLSLPTEPTRYSLVEVYPNPFNPDVSIRYYLEASFPVQLMIYDVSGRLVEELSPQDNLRSPGWHQVRWSGANLPGGIYIVKIYLPEGIVSKKLVLLK
ncbi:MAG: T9SS type A sorting domain-containing protein [Candidatus Marinimicrobia bacterium]|nr:T9SS type A sorting domain-containing protein [Candidatus Neomarinimicrobiota bacterium]